MSTEIALVLFVLIEAAGILIAVDWLRHVRTPIPRQDPRYIFRLVRREDRAAYARIMRRTTAIALRDLGRSFAKITREIGNRLLPAFERFTAKLREMLG